jgi:hypothetical protein
MGGGRKEPNYQSLEERATVDFGMYILWNNI